MINVFSYRSLRVFKIPFPDIFLSKLNHCHVISQPLYFLCSSVERLHHIFWNSVSPHFLTPVCYLFMLPNGPPLPELQQTHDPTLWHQDWIAQIEHVFSIHAPQAA